MPTAQGSQVRVHGVRGGLKAARRPPNLNSSQLPGAGLHTQHHGSRAQPLLRELAWECVCVTRERALHRCAWWALARPSLASCFRPTGTLPASWNSMVSLKALDLYLSWWEPGISPQWPDWSGMTALEYLDLSFGSDVLVTGASGASAPTLQLHQPYVCVAAELELAQFWMPAFLLPDCNSTHPQIQSRQAGIYPAAWPASANSGLGATTGRRRSTQPGLTHRTLRGHLASLRSTSATIPPPPPTYLEHG